MKKFYSLILGASSGFGKAISLTLAKDGVNIIGVHLDRASTMPEVKKLISDIESSGVEAHFFNTNAADEEKRTSIIDSISEIFKTSGGNSTIKVMVHSLAFGTLRNFIDEKPENQITKKQLDMTIDVMANSLVYWSQDLIRAGLVTTGGKIYSMTSSGGARVIEYYGAVSAAKACLESHTRQLAMELGKMGIAVNAIKAGVTDTPALRKIPNADKIIANALQRNPHGKLTDPQYIADFILDNYKRDSGWLTGNIFNLDGGESVVEL